MAENLMAENMIDLNGLVHVWSKVKTLTDNCVKASDLATVATSGSYNDLSDKPTIPSAYTLPTASSAVMGGVKIGSNISVSSGTISITKSNVTSALGYTPPTSDTVYNNATTSTAGLMSASDKVKLNSIAANANNYTHPSTHPASMITGLASVATSGSYSDLSNKPTIPVVPTNVSAFINDAGYLTQHQSLDDYAKKTDVNTALANKLGINDTAAAAIKDDAGNTISTTYASKADVSALLSTKLGVTATAYAATRDGAGNNIVNTYAKKTDIPSAYTLPNATSSTLGGVKIGSNISVSDGTISITKSNVTSALGYTPPASDTTYGDATTTSSGLMSSTDKVKLNGIADNANYYIHPSTHPASMISGLATVATSGSYNDLTNKPTIPEQITVDSEISSTSTNPVQNKIVYEVLSAVRENLLTQINNLSAVAKSGSYNDLTDKPSNATTSSAGLMSAADKSKLDGISSDSGNVKMIVYS